MPCYLAKANHTLYYLIAAAWLLAPTVPGAAEPTPSATAMIEELALDEADRPTADIPGWNPQRVAVFPLFGNSVDPAAYEAALRAAAGSVELVFLRNYAPDPQENTLAEVDAIIGLCTPQIMQLTGPSLRWLHNYSVGMDRCRGLSEAQRNRVVFTNNQRLSAPAIAEHSMAMLLSLTRKLPAFQRAQAAGQWQRQLAGGEAFGELQDKTLLVAGLGGIGTEVARRAHGLGMRVVATRNSSREGPDFVDYVGLADELLALAAQADVVVNALPLTSKTTGLFDKKFFDAVKAGAIFISVGRGKSTVTADLIAALESGKLYGAGLDVTDPEPLPAGHALWNMPNVIITPHVAASGGDSTRRTAVIAAENLRRYVAGEPLLSIVDIERGY